MTRQRGVLFSSFVLYFAVSNGLISAAEISANFTADTRTFEMDAIAIVGPIEPGDDKKLLRALGDMEGGAGARIYLDLNSDGGNFSAALKIADIMLKRNLSTILKANAKCLSACSIIFMAGIGTHNRGAYIHRLMHPTASLGFHAPRVSATSGGNFDASDLDAAYAAATDAIGKKLMSIARFRGYGGWSNPLIKPGLVFEMMSRRGSDFYMIDSVRKAAEYEIELVDAGGPDSVGRNERAQACQNAVAALIDDNETQSWDLADIHEDKRRNENNQTAFIFDRGKHGSCEIVLRDRNDEYSSNWVTVVSGSKQEFLFEDWYFWPGAKPLVEVPIEVRTGRVR